MSESKPYQTLKGRGAIAFVIVVLTAAFYYLAQIMGWINPEAKKDVKVKEEVKQVETAVQAYK